MERMPMEPTPPGRPPLEPPARPPTEPPPPLEPGEVEAPERQNQPHQYAFLALIVGALLFYAIRSGTIGRDSLIFFAVLIPSIILHEVSHGAVAYLFGDDTAKRAGRLTLNPLKHIDPFWTILLPAMMIFYTGRAFGMAKPVPVNPRNMRSPRNHSLLTSLAGPATNIALAAVAIVCLRLAYAGQFQLVGDSVMFRGSEAPMGATLLVNLGIANVVLAAFNLIPIPPLDGSAVLERLLPRQWLVPYLRLRRYSFFVFIAVFLVGGELIGNVLNPAVRLWFRVLV
jgi:Zn-dependent protease